MRLLLKCPTCTRQTFFVAFPYSICRFTIVYGVYCIVYFVAITSLSHRCFMTVSFSFFKSSRRLRCVLLRLQSLVNFSLHFASFARTFHYLLSDKLFRWWKPLFMAGYFFISVSVKS